MIAPHSCPRCGYDLSGVIASWQETCPLAATCSECGLCFELRLVLNNRLREQARFFEPARHQSGRALLTTTKFALRPWAFWRWVVMEYKPDPARMFIGVALGTLLVESVAVTLAGIAIFVPWLVDTLTARPGGWSPGIGGYLGIGGQERWLQFLVPWKADRWDPYSVGALLILGFMIQLLMPVMFLLLPQTLRRAKVRKVHLVRIGLWSLVGVPMIVGGVQFLQLAAELLNWVFQHLVARKAVFTLSAPEEFFNSVVDFLFSNKDLMLLGVIGAWTMAWWWLAVGRYLKLPRPGLITLAMGTIAALLSMLVCVIHPDLWYAIGLRF